MSSVKRFAMTISIFSCGTMIPSSLVKTFRDVMSMCNPSGFKYDPRRREKTYVIYYAKVSNFCARAAAGCCLTAFFFYLLHLLTDLFYIKLIC